MFFRSPADQPAQNIICSHKFLIHVYTSHSIISIQCNSKSNRNGKMNGERCARCWPHDHVRLKVFWCVQSPVGPRRSRFRISADSFTSFLRISWHRFEIIDTSSLTYRSSWRRRRLLSAQSIQTSFFFLGFLIRLRLLSRISI